MDQKRQEFLNIIRNNPSLLGLHSRHVVGLNDNHLMYMASQYCTNTQLLHDFVDILDPFALASNTSATSILKDERFLRKHEHNRAFVQSLTNNFAAIELFATGRLKPYCIMYNNTNPNMIPVLLKSNDIGEYAYELLSWYAKNMILFCTNPHFMPLIKKLIDLQRGTLSIPLSVANFQIYDHMWVGRVKELEFFSIDEILRRCKRKEIIDLVKRNHPHAHMVPWVEMKTKSHRLIMPGNHTHRYGHIMSRI